MYTYAQFRIMLAIGVRGKKTVHFGIRGYGKPFRSSEYPRTSSALIQVYGMRSFTELHKSFCLCNRNILFTV